MKETRVQMCFTSARDINQAFASLQHFSNNTKASNIAVQNLAPHGDPKNEGGYLLGSVLRSLGLISPTYERSQPLQEHILLVVSRITNNPYSKMDIPKHNLQKRFKEA